MTENALNEIENLDSTVTRIFTETASSLGTRNSFNSMKVKNFRRKSLCGTQLSEIN
jgi:hypothetical protein